MVKPQIHLNSKEILSLTGIRFLAVLMIFLFHYSDRLFSGVSFLSGVFHQFYLGVQIFFVLSGFVICYKYFEQSSTGKIFLLSYYLRRFAKIYPSFFCLVTLTFIIWYFKGAGNNSSFHIYILNITFLKGLSSKYYLTGIGPTWSLTVEEIFYFLSPLIFIYFKKKNILFLQVVFWWLIGGIFILIFSVFPFEGFFEDSKFVYFVTFFGRCFEFYLGIWLALYITGKVKSKKIFKKKFSIPFYTMVGFIGMGIIILLITKLSLFYSTQASELWAGIFLTNIIFPIAVMIFFFGLIKENSIIQKLFSSQLFQLLGKSSYVFFLVHTGVIATGVEKYISKNIFVIFFMIQIISILIYKFFEQPVNRWIRSKGQRLIRNYMS